MSNLLEKIKTLTILQNENTLLNNKIKKITSQKKRLDEENSISYKKRKEQIQLDLEKYSHNSNININSNNISKLHKIIPELLEINTAEYTNLLINEETNTIDLITSIISNYNTLSNTKDNCNNSNIEISENLLLELFESNTYQELNTNLKNINT